MKAFVTGASGFTGSHLVKALCDRGDTITALVRKTSNCDRLAEYPVKFIYGDITDRDALRQGMTGADVVFHTAAYVELGLVDEAKMARVNVEGTRAVLETAKELGVPKVVYCSTIGVFGDTQGEVINEAFQRTQRDFSSAYDRTKYDAQKLVDQFAAEGLNVSSLLPAGILGPDDPHFGPVMQTFLNGRLKLWAGGDRITGVVHVDDLVQAMLLAAEKGQPGGWYIISSGELSTRDMFAAVGKDAGIQPPAEAPEALVRLLGILLDPIGRLCNWQPPLSRERVHYIYDRCVRVDATKARQELGWNPRSLEQTLKDSKPL